MKSDVYILASDVATGLAPFCALSAALAEAGISGYQSRTMDGCRTSVVTCPASYINSEGTQRLFDLLDITLGNLLSQIPKLLKPIPLMLNLPAGVQRQHAVDWLNGSGKESEVTLLAVLQRSSSAFLSETLQNIKSRDALLALAVDSPLMRIEEYRPTLLHSRDTPWGVICGEGAAGVVLAKPNTLENLKVSASHKLDWFGYASAKEGAPLRKLLRYVDAQPQAVKVAITDRPLSRPENEEMGMAFTYSSAISARSCQHFMTQEYWGDLGQASALASLSLATQLSKKNASMVYGEVKTQPSQRAMTLQFDSDGGRAISILSPQ
ncbi:hypothetical protein [Thaumasiovibrio sp. DFM-14]|uniref:hypothetical protein n=1 Tax=Thaumasiovibrio sp. DFM-14 TaxID=3384792 RepID=UPI00399F93EB